MFSVRARGSCRRAGWSRYVISSAWGLNSASRRSFYPPKILVEPWSPAASNPGNPTPSSHLPRPGEQELTNTPDNSRRMRMEEGFSCPPHRTTGGVECTAMVVLDAGLTIFSRFFPLALMQDVDTMLLGTCVQLNEEGTETPPPRASDLLRRVPEEVIFQ